MRVCVSGKLGQKKSPVRGCSIQEEGFGLVGAVEYLLKPFGLVVHAARIFMRKAFASAFVKDAYICGSLTEFVTPSSSTS